MTASEYGESKLVLSLHAVRPEAGRRHTPHEQYRLYDAISAILSHSKPNHPVHGHYTGQPALAGTPVKNGRILLVQRFTIRYDTRCYFNVRSKANMSQLNLPHGTDN